jgi:hypothetical protein
MMHLASYDRDTRYRWRIWVAHSIYMDWQRVCFTDPMGRIGLTIGAGICWLLQRKNL